MVTVSEVDYVVDDDASSHAPCAPSIGLTVGVAEVGHQDPSQLSRRVRQDVLPGHAEASSED